MPSPDKPKAAALRVVLIQAAILSPFALVGVGVGATCAGVTWAPGLAVAGFLMWIDWNFTRPRRTGK